jgi:hypothetical protein
MNNVVWFTGFNSEYYTSVFSTVIDSWSVLPGNIHFYVDENIDELKNDNRVIYSHIDYTNQPIDFNKLEFKFWKKSRSIVTGIKDAITKNYDYAIWLDADVEVLKEPLLKNLLPRTDELLSANSKIPDNGTALDTGFVAFNLKNESLRVFLNEYESFWKNGKIELLKNYTFRYDAPALEKILQDNKINWKNLWYGTITHHKKEGKHYCGFQDSELEEYFYHYWGKFKRKIVT